MILEEKILKVLGGGNPIMHLEEILLVRLLVKLKSLKFSLSVQFMLSLSDCASFQAFETGKVAKLCSYCGFTRYNSYFACTLISKRFKICLPVTVGKFLNEVNSNIKFT